VSPSDAEEELFFVFLDSRHGGASSRGELFLDRKEEDEEDLLKDFLRSLEDDSSCCISSSTNIFLFDLDDDEERGDVDSYDWPFFSDRLDSFLLDSGAGDLPSPRLVTSSNEALLACRRGWGLLKDSLDEDEGDSFGDKSSTGISTDSTIIVSEGVLLDVVKFKEWSWLCWRWNHSIISG
jgi:hypothetical protein